MVLAVVARLAVVAATDEYQPLYDSADFDRHARSIADGDGYPRSQLVADGGPTAFRPPAYAYFLGLAYRIGGRGELTGRVAAALLGALVVLLLYLVAEQLWGWRVGLIAAALAAVWPTLLQWNAALLSEPLFHVITLGLVLALLRMRRADSVVPWALLAGALCALAALTRSNGIVFLFPAVIGAWVGRPVLRLRSLWEPGLVVLAAAVVLAPWAVRNSTELDALVPLNTQSGYGLAGTYNASSHHDDAYPAGWIAPQFYGPYQEIFKRPGLNEADLDAKLKDLSTDYATAHPGYVVEVVGLNTLRLFDLVASPPGLSFQSGGATFSDRTITALRIAAYALMLLGLAGVAVLWRWRSGERGPVFLWLIPAFGILAAAPVAGSPRYRAPADPFFALLAAVALGALWVRLHRSRVDASR